MTESLQKINSGAVETAIRALAETANGVLIEKEKEVDLDLAETGIEIEGSGAIEIGIEDSVAIEIEIGDLAAIEIGIEGSAAIETGIEASAAIETGIEGSAEIEIEDMEAIVIEDTEAIEAVFAGKYLMLFILNRGYALIFLTKLFLYMKYFPKLCYINKPF